MAMADLIPGMDDKALANLHSNALRLQESGAPKQQAQAAELLPLIDAELADRKPKLPPKKTPVRKAAAPKAPGATAAKKPSKKAAAAA